CPSQYRASRRLARCYPAPRRDSSHARSCRAPQRSSSTKRPDGFRSSPSGHSLNAFFPLSPVGLPELSDGVSLREVPYVLVRRLSLLLPGGCHAERLLISRRCHPSAFAVQHPSAVSRAPSGTPARSQSRRRRTHLLVQRLQRPRLSRLVWRRWLPDDELFARRN